MRKFVAGGLALVLAVGLAVGGEVSFVKFDPASKNLTVKDGDKETTYKVTDETKVKRGDKDIDLEKGLKFLSGKAQAGDKFELTADKEKKTVTEIKLKGKK